MAKKSKNNTPTPPPFILSEADIARLKYSNPEKYNRIPTDMEAAEIAAKRASIGRGDLSPFENRPIESIQPIDWDYFDGTDFTNPDSGLSLNDIMYNNQSGGEVLMHGVGRTVNKAVSEVLKLPGVFGGLIAAPFAEDGKGWETAFNNSYIKSINEASEGINNDFLPVYESDAIKYGDIFTKLSSGTFWATQGADGLGFVLSMLAPGALLKGLNVGKNIIGAAGTVGSLGKSTSTYKVLKGLADLGITADRVDNVAITLANTIFEAGSESGNAMENFEREKPQYIDNYINRGLESLNKQYTQGLINEKEFNVRSQLLQEQAEASFQEQKGLLGRDIFLHNTAILLGPNALQTKLLFGGGAKFLKEAAKPKTYKSLLKGFGTGVFSEGLFEEGLQSTVEPMLASSAKKGQLGNNPLNNFNLEELASNYVDMISSTDGQSAVILGAVLGGPMNAYGQFRQDQNDYKVTNAILGAYGNHVNSSFNGMIDLYKRDDQGNIKLDRNNKPVIDTAKSANAIKGNMTSEYLNRLHDEAIKNDNVALHDYLKNITANDLAMSFVNQGETGKDALNEYLNSYRENLQSNESYKPEVKETLLKDVDESIKATKRAFDKMYSSSQAFDLMQKNLLPDPNEQRRQGMSEEEISNFARLQKIAFLRNLGMRDALNIGIQNSTKELNLLHDTQFPNRRPSALEANEESFNEFVSSQPSLVGKYTEVQNMRDAHDELMKEFTEMLTNPNYIAKEAEAYIKEQRKISQKTALSTDFNKLVSDIKLANNQKSLDNIKLPENLSSFKEEFDIAKNRRQKELDSKSEIAKREAIIANSTLSDNGMNVTGTFSNPQTDFEIGNDPYTNEAGAGLLYDNAEMLAPIEVDYDDLQNSGYDFEINEQGEIIDLDPDQSSLDPNLHSLKSKKELYDESIENLLNEHDGTIDTETGGTETGSKLTKEETFEEDDTFTSKDGDNVLDSELNEGYTVPVSMGNNTYQGSYDFEGAAEYDDIPDDGVDSETEITTNNAQILEGQLKEIDETVPNVKLAVHDKYTGEAFSYVLKLPRLIVWNVNQKVLKYFKENRRKHKDEYIVNINKKPYAFNQNAVNIYNNKILKNIPLTAEEYLEVLYKLPLTVNVNNNPDLNINLDAASGVNVIWSEDNKNIIGLHKGSLDFANAFTTRLYIINAMINNPTAPIKLLFSKQYGGMLNFNRTLDTGKSISTSIANTNNLLDIKDTENKIKFLQNSLSYVDLEGNVRGIANDRVITDRVSTPGIIYLRVNDLAGNPQNIQLTRNKLFNLDSELGANQMDEFVDILLDTMMQDKTAFELSFDQYLERRADDVDEINSLFEKPLEIMRNTPKYKLGNFTLQDFISFFVHTSSNSRTKLSFQKTYIGFGEIAKQKTSLGQYLDNNNRLQYSLLDSESITDQDLLNIRQGVKEYLNLLKHNVSKNYANDPNYIEYLSDNVLMIDTHPYQDIFVTERTYFNRDQNQVVTEKQPADIYVKSMPVVEGVNSFQIPNGAFEMITEPNLKMLLERAITLPNIDNVVESVESIESTITPEVDTTVYTPVITTNSSDFNIGTSNMVVNVNYVNNEESETFTDNTEQQKADIERRRQEELNSEKVRLYKKDVETQEILLEKEIKANKSVQIINATKDNIKLRKGALNNIINKINAKYDAELDALETKTESAIDTGINNPYTDRYLVGNEILDKETGALILDFESNDEALSYFLDNYVNEKPLVKEGVEEVFNENPELASIGTQEQYSQYLDTIFPDSKVKDIVYHYTDAKKFDRFIKDHIGTSVQRTGIDAADSQLGIFFGNKGLVGVLNSEKLGKTEIQTLINIKNPNYDIYDKADNYLYSSDRFIDEQEPSFDIDIEEDENGNFKTVYKEASKSKGKEFERNWYNSYKQDLINEGVDGIITDNIKVVFEPEQIHILGSQADIQGFKKFISNESNITISNAPKSSLYQIGKSFYRIKGDSNKGYTVTNSKTGARLKANSPIFKKVLVEHRPDLRDVIYPPKQIKAKPAKEPSFSKWNDALDYLEYNGAISTPYLAALGYFANPKGLVSREGVQNNESGKKWYEGPTSGKTTSKVTTKWEGVAHILYEQYPHLDSIELASAVEEVMLSFGSRKEVQNSLIDEAVKLRKANEGYMSAEEVEERNRYYIEQEYGPETLALYDSMEAESTLTGDDLVNYYEALANQQLNSLTQEQQQQLYEEIEEPVLTSDERTTESEVASIAESDGNLQEASTEFRTFEQIKQDVQGYENYYNNSNLEQKAQIVTDVLTELGFQEWTDFLDTLETEQSLDTWFNNSIESLKQSNNATEYLNKICSF